MIPLTRRCLHLPTNLKICIDNTSRRNISAASVNTESSKGVPFPSTASTLVIGGGVVGTSVAYHLARQGEDNVLLVEKAQLTAGSTWHAAGLTTAFHPGINLKNIHYCSLNLYSQLSHETGQDIGFHQCGSLRIATTPERLEECHFQMSRMGHFPAPQSIIDKKKIQEFVPFINTQKILGGLYNPYDGYVDPYSLTQALAKAAKKYGAVIRENTQVTSLTLKDDGKWLVESDKGAVLADKVVNAAGFHAREVGEMAGLRLPLVPIHHQYVVTSTIPEVTKHKEIPVLRELEASCYIRQERSGILVGVYESPETMHLCEEWMKTGVPKSFGKELFQSDLDRIMPHLEMAMDLLPCLRTASIQSVVNGPITYSPDILPIIGPSEQPNMWIIAGFGYGIIHAGGASKYLVDWMLKGEPQYDLIECDPLRYEKWTSDEFTISKARESFGMNTAMGYPHEERFAGRPTNRVSSAYSNQLDRGAHMLFHSGWEQPGWFAAKDERPEYKPSFKRTNWHNAVEREWISVTTKAGVIDLTPFAKFIIEGKSSTKFLDRVTANVIPKVGKTVISHILTPRGRVFGELTTSRIGEEKYFVITGSGSEGHDLRWLKDIAYAEKWQDLCITNVTEDIGCLSVAGPEAKTIMQTFSPRFSEPFPFLSNDQISIDGEIATVLRLSYTGEFGYEIYVPRQNVGKFYEMLLEAGETRGLNDFGTLCMNALRLEKGFKAWGSEMNVDRNPVEADLMAFVKKDKGDFIGRSALQEILKEQTQQRLVMVKIDTDVDPIGDETIWVENTPVGNTTSGCFSPLLQKPLAFAYLPHYLSTPGIIVQVELMGAKYKAEVLPSPPALPEVIRNRR